jgi:hypothetical protein
MLVRNSGANVTKNDQNPVKRLPLAVEGEIAVTEVGPEG